MSLVGRSREVAVLDGAVGEAIAGRGGIVLLTGEPGIGKSTLAEHAAAIAAERGALVTWGRAWEAGGAPPFWPWIEVVRTVLDAHDDAELRRWLGRSASDLAELVPDLADRLELPAPSPLAPGAERFRMFDVVASFLARSAQAAPILVVLEDLHVADASSLLLLEFVAPRLSRSHILVVGTYRDVEARRAPEVQAVLGKVGRHARTVAVRRLDRAAVGELMEQAGLSAADELLGRVYDATEGNALFVAELLRVLRVRADEGDAIDVIDVPDGVRGAIRDHLKPLGAEVREMLEVGAVIGRDFGVALVAEVAGASVQDVAATLALAGREGVIAEVGPGRHRFAHVLVRDVLYDDAALPRRTELHARLAAALERIYGEDPEAPHAEIARHLASAGAGYSLRAVDAWVRASRRARDKLAFEEAVVLLERALATLEAVLPGDPARRFELLLELGQMRLRAGHTQRGAKTCLDAVAVARELGSPEALARAALAYGGRLMLALRDPTLIGLLEEALEKLPPGDGALRARAMARLAAAEMPANEPAIPIATARAAVEMARRLGDRHTLLSVLNGAGSAMADFAPPLERRAVDQELVALAMELGDRPLVLRGLARLVIDDLELGDLDASDDHIREYDHLATEFRQPHVQWLTYLLRSVRPLLEGRFEEARTLADTARAVAARGGDVNAELTLQFHEWTVARQRADPVELARVGPVLMERLGTVGKGANSPMTRLFTASLRGSAGDVEAARVAMADFDPGSSFLDETLTMALAAEVWALLGDADKAAWVLDHRPAGHFDDHMVVFGLAGIGCEGPITRPLMQLAITCARWDDAERFFQAAHDRATELRALPCLTMLELDWAEALPRRAGPGDVPRAAALAASAAERGRALGMTAIADRAAALAERLGPKPAAARPSSPAPLPPPDLDRAQDAKLASLAELVAGIAHEINNPLGALQSTADVSRRAVEILKEALGDPSMAAVLQRDPRLARALQVLVKTQGVAPEATERIAKVVTDLRRFARLDQASVDRIDLRDSLDSTLAILGRELDGRVDIVRRYGEVPAVLCRPREIHDALRHLLRNAAQSIEVRGTITLSLAREGEQVVLAIEDTGSGIPPENLKRIFDPGFTTRGSGVGIGLGLSIVFQVVREHGGTLEVDSAPGRGSIFTLRLPLEAAVA